MIILFWMITVLSVVIDRITKYIAESGISEGQLRRAITLGDTDILAFSMHKNTGAAFSSFTGKTMALAMVPVPTATNGGFAPFRAMTPFTPLAHMDSLSLWCRSWS